MHIYSAADVCVCDVTRRGVYITYTSWQCFHKIFRCSYLRAPTDVLTYIHTCTRMYICLSVCTLTDSLWATHSCCLIHFRFSALALGNLLEQHMHTHAYTYVCACVYVFLFFVCFCFGSLLYCCRPSSPSVVVFRQFFAHVRLKRLKQRDLSCDFDEFGWSSKLPPFD